ncbi:YciI family protein [Pseudalkalibacillus caeni]|uniref:YciI family protein n=1 Tax=Exobacillus caeni TaxID=2574798 RepID=A0A5R9F180_9BACL|nr:YciI family protein [Pseudalkalibacillus caeni]TLS36186.1 YciI family protein [Pseudalkalibacillus caeni]
MLFMLIVKASQNSEGGNLPSPELNEAMSKYNEELVKAGVRVAAKGLYPSSNGIRISFPKPGEKPVVTDGPFTETKELIAGFILIDVKSREEAIEWAMRMPDPQGLGEGQIELRQVIEDPIMFAREAAKLRKKSEKEKL